MNTEHQHITDSDEGKEMIQELLELDSTIVEIAETSEYNIKKHESQTSKKEAEFTVKNFLKQIFLMK